MAIKKQKEKIVIVMPTYNEAENIGPMIEELCGKRFPEIKNVDLELLVVDDNSPDGTGNIVKEKSKKYKNVHLLSGQKAGLGMAYVRGMKYAMKEMKADGVMEMDSDFQHDPQYVKPMVEAFSNGADYAIGTRYMKGGSIPKGWALHRKAVSYLGNLFARLVLWQPKLHDLTTGFRLTRVEGVLEKIDLDNLMALNRFAYKVDLFYQTVNLSKKVVEVPIHFAERTKESSKFSLKEMIATYVVVMKLRLKASARFIKFGIVGFVGYLVNAIGLEIFSRLELVDIIAKPFLFLQGSPLAFVAEPSAWAAALAAEVAIVNNFTFNNLWTFKEVKINSPLMLVRKFLEFNLTSVGAIIIQFVVIGIMVGLWNDTTLVRQLGILVSMPLVLAFNYTMYNLFIWKTWSMPGRKK